MSAALNAFPFGNDSTERDSAHTHERSVVPLRPLSPRQMDALVAIERYIEARGYPPTVREICRMMGLASLGSVFEHMRALVKKGFLELDAGERRGMRVIAPSSKAAVIQPRPLVRAKVHLCAKCRREIREQAIALGRSRRRRA